MFVAQVKISTVNTLLTVLYLFVALPAAGIVSLIFLVVIHKAEYFLNAKIIGEQVNAKAFELLLVMIIFEHLFGIGGIVLAPVCYAYLKKELISHQIIG